MVLRTKMTTEPPEGPPFLSIRTLPEAKAAPSPRGPEVLLAKKRLLSLQECNILQRGDTQICESSAPGGGPPFKRMGQGMGEEQGNGARGPHLSLTAWLLHGRACPCNQCFPALEQHIQANDENSFQAC